MQGRGWHLVVKGCRLEWIMWMFQKKKNKKKNPALFLFISPQWRCFIPALWGWLLFMLTVLIVFFDCNKKKKKKNAIRDCPLGLRQRRSGKWFLYSSLVYLLFSSSSFTSSVHFPMNSNDFLVRQGWAMRRANRFCNIEKTNKNSTDQIFFCV